MHSIPIALTPPNLTDLDRKNTHSFVLPLSRPSDQSTAMNIATQCVSQFVGTVGTVVGTVGFCVGTVGTVKELES